MNTAASNGFRRLAVWDGPTRIFHWLLAALFALAWVTGEEEGLFLVHRLAGYGILTALVFRIGWGLVGNVHARFSNFLCGPRPVFEHLRALARLRPERSVGHNPAGGWMTLILLLSVAALTVSGLGASDDGLSGPLAGRHGELLAEVHEGLAEAVLLLVFLHVGGVLAESLLTRDNLTGAMLRGWKRWPEALPASDADPVPWWRAAVVLATASGAVWWLITA